MTVPCWGVLVPSSAPVWQAVLRAGRRALIRPGSAELGWAALLGVHWLHSWHSERNWPGPWPRSGWSCSRIPLQRGQSWAGHREGFVLQSVGTRACLVCLSHRSCICLGSRLLESQDLLSSVLFHFVFPGDFWGEGGDCHEGGHLFIYLLTYLR